MNTKNKSSQNLIKNTKSEKFQLMNTSKNFQK
uniref:Uncharacterized protein n=1 Tax=virus sp. ctkyY8 TaxID=2827995 RepID=A0A8S5RDP8_9VIRU|nr:MAG TPA: hypothetical protein [virus sp. ctkyY8]